MPAVLSSLLKLDAASLDADVLRRCDALLQRSLRLRSERTATLDDVLAFRSDCDALMRELEAARARVLRDAVHARLRGFKH